MDRIEMAFNKVNRILFAPKEYAAEADYDIPLSIGYGQAISQPSTVRMMLEWLEARQGDKVLDIGSGSGWSSALLSYIVGNKGKVFAVEIIPGLLKIGKENCKKLGVNNVEFYQANEEIGLPNHAPYDRILVSAAAKTLPRTLLKQLNIGGKMVIPVVNDILEIKKLSKTRTKVIKHPGFFFVPLKNY